MLTFFQPLSLLHYSDYSMLGSGHAAAMAVEQTGWFIDVKDLPQDGHGLFQVCTLAFIYGYGLLYVIARGLVGMYMVLNVSC